MTDAERRLWRHIKIRQLDGKKFRRQAPIGDYIVDFVCFGVKLIVELDGGQHASQVQEDDARTAWLNSQGFRVMRFWDYQIFEELEPVLEAIWNAVRDIPPPRSSPTRGEGVRRDDAKPL
jgi:very-short-patch-repair endonuclease